MKTNILMAIAIVTGMAVNAQSQKVQPWSGKNPKEVRQVARPEGFNLPVPGLDDKQREEIGKIRTEQVKERTQTRNLLEEKRAKLEVLQTADKPDMKEIGRVIDEIAAVQAKEMKAKAADRQKIRSLLTEEQRIYFDAQGAGRDRMRAGRKATIKND
ncbi:MAG: periplasmic heavy metal sensor [Bacteroidales bacterium]|jgi:Spy/CpxP family protein refolding chaperone|nr:periplasmic heavy metal sensor [Bacteroidales bacterium]